MKFIQLAKFRFFFLIIISLTTSKPVLSGVHTQLNTHEYAPDNTPAPKSLQTPQAHPSDTFYTLDRVLNINISTTPEDWDSLRSQTRTIMDIISGDCLAQPHEDVFSWFRATVTVDGETLSDVGIRKKGFFGSLSKTKPALKLRFDKFVNGQFLGGLLKRITLNNVQQDPSMINTCMSYHLFEKAGLPAPRCNFAKVRINNQDLGLFVHVESIKTAFLERNFGDATGNLYEGNISDFRPNWRGTFVKKTNKDRADFSDIDSVVNALQDSSAEGLHALDEIIDVDRFLSFWATEVLIGHWDGYTGNRNNYYFYREPDGRFIFIPWGTDATFTTIDSPFDDFRSPPSVAAHGAIAHRLYHEALPRYIERMRHLLSTVWNESELLELTNKMAEIVQSNALAQNRPRASRDLERVRNFIRHRRSKILADLDPEPPEWPWPMADASFCRPETGTFYAEFQAELGTQGSYEPLKEGRVQYIEYKLGGVNQKFEATGVTAGIEKETGKSIQTLTLTMFGLRTNSDVDMLIVSIPLEKVLSGSMSNIDGLHMIMPPPYTVPNYDGFIGRGHIIFDETGIDNGDMLIGRVYGNLYDGQLSKHTERGGASVEITDDDTIALKDLILNEVTSKGEPLDWFELYNPTDVEIDLFRFLVADDLVDEGKRVRFPQGLTIQPGEYLQIALDKETWPGFALGSDEELGIWREDGRMVDQVDWAEGEAGKGSTFARIPDIKGEFQTVDHPTPASPNPLHTITFGLVLNEIAAKGEPTDWFELHNVSAQPINLSEFTFADDLYDESKRVPFEAGMAIEPGEYLRIDLDKDNWPGFALGSDEELGIWNLDGVLVDKADWEDGQSTEGHSFARIPNVVGPFQTVNEPTPAAPNWAITAILETSRDLPKVFRLQGNWPNPFNARTVIGFELPISQPLRLIIYDVLGRQVRQLYSGTQIEAGYYESVWDGLDDHRRPVASGIYFFRLSSNDVSAIVGRMTLIR